MKESCLVCRGLRNVWESVGCVNVLWNVSVHCGMCRYVLQRGVWREAGGMCRYIVECVGMFSTGSVAGSLWNVSVYCGMCRYVLHCEW